MSAFTGQWDGIEADIAAVRNGVATPEQQKHVGVWIAAHMPRRQEGTTDAR